MANVTKGRDYEVPSRNQRAQLLDQHASCNSQCVSFCRRLSYRRATLNADLVNYSTLAQANHTELSNRLSDAEQKNQDATDAQNALLVQVRDRLEKNNTLVSASNAITTKVKEALRLKWFTQLGAELKDFMRRIISINVATYNAVIAIQGSLAGGLERSLIQEPFILEDAIGRVSPVHMQFISSWEAFHAVLDRRFQDVQGYKKVKNKEYILQERASRREISQSCPWDGAVLPGQRVDMSLIFSSEEKETVRTSCPSCRTESGDPQEAEVLWYVVHNNL
jgi:hypothetical protein